MSVDVRDRVVLLLSELVANSVMHSGLSAPDEVELAVRSIPGGLHVEVTDHGVGIDHHPMLSLGRAHFGLMFVDALSDRWGYTNEPTRVWFDITGQA